MSFPVAMTKIPDIVILRKEGQEGGLVLAQDLIREAVFCDRERKNDGSSITWVFTFYLY